MPLLFQKNINLSTQIGIWQIEESEAWFLEKIVLSESELLELYFLKGKKRVEWLADRHALQVIMAKSKRISCIKDAHGKPFLAEKINKQTNKYISFSNSADKAMVALSDKNVGVDIQYITEKINRIEQKFMRKEEAESVSIAHRMEQLHVFWGAKEALYKAYGKRALDFKQHIFVTPFTFDLAVGTTTGIVEKEQEKYTFDIFYEQIDNFILVTTEETLP
jgi:phosphopantetheinyl transferase